MIYKVCYCQCYSEHNLTLSFVLFNDTWSQYGHSVLCMTILCLHNHLIRHQATYKAGCQPGDCIWPTNVPWGLSGYHTVCMGWHTLFITSEWLAWIHSTRSTCVCPSPCTTCNSITCTLTAAHSTRSTCVCPSPCTTCNSITCTLTAVHTLLISSTTRNASPDT